MFSSLRPLTGFLRAPDNLNRQIQTFFTESAGDFAHLGITPEVVLRVTMDKAPLIAARAALVTEQSQINLSLDSAVPGSFTQHRAELAARIKQLEDALDEPNRRYRAYEVALEGWEAQRIAIIGTAETAGTIASYEAQLADLDHLPDRLRIARESRLGKAKEIHEVIRELSDTYRELYAPVNKFIKNRPIATNMLHLNFEVDIVDNGFLGGFFDLVSQGSDRHILRRGTRE